MPTVNGSEPDIAVKFAGTASTSDGTETLRLANDDDGVPREIHRGGDAVLVTGEELRSLSSYEVEVVDKDEVPAQTGEDTSPGEPSRASLTPTGQAAFGSAGSSSSGQSTTPGTTG